MYVRRVVKYSDERKSIIYETFQRSSCRKVCIIFGKYPDTTVPGTETIFIIVTKMRSMGLSWTKLNLLKNR